MSLEESMKAQADAMNNLANAMNRYATLMEKVAAAGGLSLPAPTAPSDPTPTPEPSAAATTPKATRGRKATTEKATTPAANAEVDAFEEGGDTGAEEDPFGEAAAPAAKAITAEDIRTVVLKVKEKNKDHALKLLAAVGVTTLSQIQEKDYQKVIDLAKKVGVSL